MGSETSSLREQIQGISKQPKAQKTLIPLQGQVFVWRYLPAKQKIYPQRPQRLCGENPILDKHELYPQLFPKTKMWVYIFISTLIFILLPFLHPAIGSETSPFKISKFITAYDFNDAHIPFIASHFDIMDTYLNKVSQVHKIKDLNPAFKAIFYDNALTHKEGATGDWYVRDAKTGSRLVNKDWGWYLMDIGNPTYRTSLANFIKNNLANNPVFDGVFLDDVWGAASLGEFYREGTKEQGVIPKPTIDCWHENMKTLLSEIKAAIANKLLIINAGYYNTDYLTISDGQMDEAFCHSNWQSFGEYYPSPSWERHLSSMVAGSNSKKIYLAQSGIQKAATDDETRRTVRYCFAMFLLGASSNSYFYFSKTYRGVTYFPEWDVDLGNPTEDYHARTGSPLYEREYSKGLVIINPSAESFQINLGEKYKNLDGVVTDTITLGTHEGEILLKSSEDTAPPAPPKGLRILSN